LVSAPLAPAVGLHEALFAGPQSSHANGGALAGGVHGAQAAALAATVLAEALPGLAHAGNSLTSLIDGLPASSPISGSALGGAAAGVGAGAVFHAAMMGPGFGAFEFSNHMATLTHHSLVAGHA
jgi:hypothetical protein